MIRNNIRMLAAIMFTDMVGYTMMMQENEEKAKKIRDRYREVLKKSISEHLGQILQFYGDGSLSIFGSAFEASLAALEIRKELEKEPKINTRIGIHIGDIVYEDEGIYGDGVNVASRIEGIATSGGILISDKVNDEIKNHPEIITKSLGYFELKNVKKPIEIFALLDNENSFNILFSHIKKTSNLFKNSIAVLPFVNMSNDSENEYFSDGITEEILNALTKIEQLRIASRTSSFAFKGKNADVRDIGKQLNVDHVLEGSVRKAGNKVRITAQLIDVNNGYHIWSESFNREIKDIFEIQEEISNTIASRLELKLLPEKKKISLHNKTENTRAYNIYLKGLYLWNNWSPESVTKALEYFNVSIQIDPKYALPYTGISNSYCFLGAYGFLSPKESYEKAEQAAMKALELCPSQSEAFTALGLVNMLYHWNWNEAEKNFLTALDLNPNSSAAYHGYSMFLISQNRLEEALLTISEGLTIDPLSLPMNALMGEILFYQKNFEKAEEQYKKTLELNPAFRSAWWSLGILYSLTGNFEGAFEAISKGSEMLQDKDRASSSFAILYARFGQLDKAKVYLDRYLKRAENKYTNAFHFDMAVIHAALNNKEEVLDYLEKSLDDRLGGLVFIKVQDIWDKFRDEPRFNKILERLKLN